MWSQPLSIEATETESQTQNSVYCEELSSLGSLCNSGFFGMHKPDCFESRIASPIPKAFIQADNKKCDDRSSILISKSQWREAELNDLSKCFEVLAYNPNAAKSCLDNPSKLAINTNFDLHQNTIDCLRPKPTEPIMYTETSFHPIKSPVPMTAFASTSYRDLDVPEPISPRTQRCVDLAVEYNKAAVEKVETNKGNSRDKVRVKPSEAIDGLIYIVRFKRAHKAFVISPTAPRNIPVGVFVKVEADRGEDLGVLLRKVPISEYIEDIPTAGYRGRGFSSDVCDRKFILRIATPFEKMQIPEKVSDEEEVLEVIDLHSIEYNNNLLQNIRIKVMQRKLPMVILDAEFQFDRHKLTYYFEADVRIDFRDLVSELFSLYKTRIWMQQVDTTNFPRPDDLEVQLAYASGLLPKTSLLSVIRSYAGTLLPQEAYNQSPAKFLSPVPPVMWSSAYKDDEPKYTCNEIYQRQYDSNLTFTKTCQRLSK